MNDKTLSYQDGVKAHSKSLGIFLVFILISSLIFFYFVQTGVEKNTESIITNNVERQSEHFEDILTLHFEYLEGIASFFAEEENILSDKNIQLLESLTDKSSLQLLAIISPDGTITYSTGEKRSVANRAYFQKAMTGERALSEPVFSKADGTSRIILAVPVFRENEVIGVLGGSCDVSSLSNLIFNDIYDGAGHISIVNADGTVISCGIGNNDSSILTNDSFFDLFSNKKFAGTTSYEQFCADFAEHSKGLIKLSVGGELCYMAYQPLELNDWFLCYVVPVSAAQESYQFISDYEFILFGILLTAMLILLLNIFRSNTKKQRELLVLGQTDALTGILNKQATENEIKNWLSDKQCIGIQAFIILDIDGFKEINDIYGHMVGDTILSDMGSLLRHEFRETDIIGRIGGDEFCILVKNSVSESVAANRAEKLCQHIQQHKFNDVPCSSITISVGVAFSPRHGQSYSDLYIAADKALYQTKRNGKNSYTIFTADTIDA